MSVSSANSMALEDARFEVIKLKLLLLEKEHLEKERQEKEQKKINPNQFLHDKIIQETYVFITAVPLQSCSRGGRG
jgi:hypothetical protein